MNQMGQPGEPIGKVHAESSRPPPIEKIKIMNKEGESICETRKNQGARVDPESRRPPPIERTKRENQLGEPETSHQHG